MPVRTESSASLAPSGITPPLSTPSRIITGERRDEDLMEASIRPQILADFVGQSQARENLSVYIEAARRRADALDHVLFVGPPGLGKTTLAQIVAKELGVNFRSTSGPVIAKAGDLAAQLPIFCCALIRFCISLRFSKKFCLPAYSD